jgi:hypothetical protein
MDNVKSINYLYKDNFGTSKMYQLDVLTCKEIRMKTLGSDKKLREDILTKEELNKKASLLLNFISTCSEKYINNKILDGFEFKILVEYVDNTSKLIYGKNKFPANFSEFKYILGEI